MAKSSTESTAVNQLIEMVATQKPLPPDPSDDLMFKAPPPIPTRATKIAASAKAPTAPAAPASPRSMSTPRMSTAPSRAGEVPPLPRTRAPHGTQQNQVPPLPPAVRVSTARPARATSIPPLPPVARRHPSDAEVTNPGLRAAPPRPSSPAPRPSLSSTSSFEYPIAPSDSAAITAPAGATKPAFAASHAADMTGHAPWFEASAPMPRVEQADIGTQMVQRPTSYAHIARKLIGPMAILFVIGILIGGYFAFDRDGGTPRTPVAAAAPTPTEGPTIKMAASPVPSAVPAATDNVEPVQAAPAMPEVAPAPSAPEPAAITPPNLAPTTPAQPVVDVRIDSTPAGATVVLVDRGKTTFLGTTPMSASLDPSRSYELVFTAERRATTVQAVDPSKTTRVAVALAREGTRPAKAKAKPVAAAPRSAPALAEPTFEVPAKPVKAKPVAGEGVLMISSKPPCEIVIDGKATGLMTPQRALKLPAGTHAVTLVNASAGIQKTVGVQITANKPTKLIQDFMK